MNWVFGLGLCDGVDFIFYRESFGQELSVGCELWVELEDYGNERERCGG